MSKDREILIFFLLKIIVLLVLTEKTLTKLATIEIQRRMVILKAGAHFWATSSTTESFFSIDCSSAWAYWLESASWVLAIFLDRYRYMCRVVTRDNYFLCLYKSFFIFDFVSFFILILFFLFFYMFNSIFFIIIPSPLSLFEKIFYFIFISFVS